MTQTSGPLATGTLAERQFTDVLWRDLFGGEAGVVADYDGSAYAISLPVGSDVASVGSATQASLAQVAGFSHKIPQGEPESITVTPATGVTQTHIIALRYDPAYTGAPGPVRLVLIPGTSAALPSYDDASPGVEELPLWGVTRQPGQALSQATLQRLFPRLAPNLSLPEGVALPPSSPLGTVLQQGRRRYRREMGTAGVPVWTSDVMSVSAGAAGALAGAAPPDGTPVYKKTFYGSISLNANGDGTVVYPGGAFANGVTDIFIQHISQGGPPSNDIGFKAWNVALNKTSVRCYTPSGATFGGTGVAATLAVWGW